MSYILDALKRADAERERGAVPGLHSQSLASPVSPTAPANKTRVGLALTAVVILGSIALGTWVWRAPASEVKLAAVVPSQIPAALAITPAATPVTALPMPTAASATEVPMPVTVLPAATKPALVASVTPAAVTARPKQLTDAGTKPAASVTAAPASIPLLSELPEELRRQIPALVITGAVYSEIPANRLLLLNNQVITQASQAAPDVSLEEIRPKSAVFNFKGTRFRVAH